MTTKNKTIIKLLKHTVEPQLFNIQSGPQPIWLYESLDTGICMKYI